MARIGQVPKSQLYAGPGYNLFDPPAERGQIDERTMRLDDAAMCDAAEAVRAAELEAIENDDVDSDDTDLDSTHLESMSIDDLRIVAELLEVPDRARIIDRNALIAAIECCR